MRLNRAIQKSITGEQRRIEQLESENEAKREGINELEERIEGLSYDIYQLDSENKESENRLSRTKYELDLSYEVNERLKSENERLREALKEIAGFSLASNDLIAVSALKEEKRIARQALRGDSK
ncbi:hypothetical protein [Lentibacillus amyloliquefaciens]|uniref:Uncharacterized protein n=1 Tax=Lentibacillus amyloliquefaciens TaxID=1472767 RepID=A0A0U3WBP8_9BACI|nr:hypothetical protein [Lentibacillus amyloliquefaciens]ALX50448.1 hypothetical protein AOX59_18800 [Lentibacillus amyloliquefaciens]